MGDNDGRSPSWILADGSASISVSALGSVLIQKTAILADVWGLRLLQELTNQEDGVIIVASLLLFPATFIIYGVARMIFAAKEAVERKARKQGRAEGREEALKELREALEKSGVQVPPEVARIIAHESGPRS